MGVAQLVEHLPCMHEAWIGTLAQNKPSVVLIQSKSQHLEGKRIRTQGSEKEEIGRDWEEGREGCNQNAKRINQ